MKSVPVPNLSRFTATMAQTCLCHRRATHLLILYPHIAWPIVESPGLTCRRLPQISPQSSHANSQPLLEGTSGGSPASPEHTPEDTPPPDMSNVGGLSKDDQDTDLRDFTVWDSVQSLDFWILWISMFIGTAAGFVLLSNVGEPQRKPDFPEKLNHITSRMGPNGCTIEY